MELAALMKKAGMSISEKEEESLLVWTDIPLVKIKLLAGGRGAVWIGDFKVPGTTKVSFNSEVGDVTRVNIEMIALGGIEVEAQADVSELELKVLDKYRPIVVKE